MKKKTTPSITKGDTYLVVEAPTLRAPQKVAEQATPWTLIEKGVFDTNGNPVNPYHHWTRYFSACSF